MLAECSGVAITIDVTAIPIPPDVALARWLATFPSYGYLLAVAPGDVAAVIDRFGERGIAAADIGSITAGHAISITDGRGVEVIRDFASAPLILAATAEPALRIALPAHSTYPRGGVVHALAVGDALVRLGLEATVHAPDARGAGYFRRALCKTVSVAASAYRGDTAAMVGVRVADYLRHLGVPAQRRFDVFHAQDGISGNALATLKERGLIRRFARTVHHIDAFADPRLAALQERAITSADALFVVSRQVQAELANRFGREATVV
eukprot:gene35945-42625_t